jgi:hypothetical protein
LLQEAQHALLQEGAGADDRVVTQERQNGKVVRGLLDVVCGVGEDDADE